MAELGPLRIVAHNRDQAEYLVRSQAEQRGVEVTDIDVSAAGTGVWIVTVSVTDTEKGESAHLGEDTAVLHLNTRSPGSRPAGY